MKLLLAFLLLIIPLASTAAAYRWVDENGNVRFGGKPKPEQPAPTKKPTKPINTKKISGNKLPTLPSTSVPKTEIKKPPAPQTAKPAQKPAPQKKKEEMVKAAPKTDKKASQPLTTNKAATKKKPISKPATPPVTETTSIDKADKDAELCGTFTAFVGDYENKLIDCQGSPCIVYERSLAKYQKKKQAYCR